MYLMFILTAGAQQAVQQVIQAANAQAAQQRATLHVQDKTVRTPRPQKPPNQ